MIAEHSNASQPMSSLVAHYLGYNKIQHDVKCELVLGSTMVHGMNLWHRNCTELHHSATTLIEPKVGIANRTQSGRTRIKYWLMYWVETAV